MTTTSTLLKSIKSRSSLFDNDYLILSVVVLVVVCVIIHIAYGVTMYDVVVVDVLEVEVVFALVKEVVMVDVE